MTAPPTPRAPLPRSTWKGPLAILAALLLAPLACALPGQRSALVRGDDVGLILDRCATAVEAMHFQVKAIDRSHQILLAEGRVEGGLRFHDVRLSIKVVYVEGKKYRVEAIATSDQRGIRAGAEKKARKMFFEKLRETGIVIKR